MSDEPHVVKLSDLKAAAAEEIKQFKTGDAVVIDYSYSGIWAELGGLTGVITKLRNDAMWMFDIALDHPEFISDLSAWNSTDDGGLYVSLGVGGVFLIEEIKQKQPEIIPKLNRGLGLGARPLCTELPALTDINHWLDAIDKIIEDARKVHRQNLDNVVNIRKKHVDNLPEIIALEKAKDKAQKKFSAYFNSASAKKNQKTSDKLSQKVFEAQEALRKAFTERRQWAEANIPELGDAEAKYKITSKEFYAFEKAKLKEQDEIIHQYVGRRHVNLVKNGKQKVDSEGFLEKPMRCLNCNWAFIVRTRD